MQVVPVTEPQAWDRALLRLPNPHLLQSWSWGAFKSRHGWRANRFLFREAGQTVAAAALLCRPVPRLPWAVCYVPKGPLLDWTDTALAARVLTELVALARRQGAILLKIDPDVYYAEAAPSFSPRPANAAQVARLLKERGWRFSSEQIQFRNTVLLDLRPSEEELLAAMKQKTRYNVRLAARRGVVVRRISAAETPAQIDGALHTFYGLYLETSRRDGFLIRSPAYYLDVWRTFLEEGAAHLLLAEVEGEALAGLMLFTFGQTAWYLYGASSGRRRKYMPNQLLQWTAIQQARAAGCTLYDLWGAPDRLDESDPMWGVYRFKLGLGGQLARGLGAWDFPVRRTAYRLYTLLMPRYLDWQRRRHGAASDQA